MSDIGDRKITVSLRTLVAVFSPLVVGAFICGMGWFSLNAKVDAAIEKTKPIGEIQKDVCRLKNYMINGTRPNPFDGCQ